MNLALSDIASIAEVIGAIAVVISLIYVGMQLTDSTRAVRSATANEMYAAISSWYTHLGTDAQACSLFFRGMENLSSLSPEERLQFILLVHGIMLEYQAAYYLSQEGTLDIELRESMTNTMSGLRELPGLLSYWEQRRSLFKPDFREYVDKIFSSGTTAAGIAQAYQSHESSQ